MRTVRLRAAECRLPLERPIRLGPVTITTCDFVALRMETDAGWTGDAIGYPRGTPLLPAVKAIGRRFVGISPTHRREHVEGVLGAFVNGRPAFVRAASLFDIALHDIAAKAAGLPLYQMLGAVRDVAQVQAVAGYFLDQRTIESVVDEVSGLVQQGFPWIKIMVKGYDVDFDRKLVEAVLKVAEGRVGVDAHWAWRSLPEALRTCRAIDDVGLRYIEDPFGAHQSHLMARLQPLLRTPLAAGEDMPDTDALLRLTDTLSILRIDATTCGGIAAAAGVVEAAALRGVSVLPHIFTGLHAQMAGTYRAIDMVEMIPAATGADPLELLLTRGVRIVDGACHIDQEPGAGTELNWEAVTRYAVDTVEIDVDG